MRMSKRMWKRRRMDPTVPESMVWASDGIGMGMGMILQSR
jgi:hypothetical protein